MLHFSSQCLRVQWAGRTGAERRGQHDRERSGASGGRSAGSSTGSSCRCDTRCCACRAHTPGACCQRRTAPRHLSCPALLATCERCLVSSTRHDPLLPLSPAAPIPALHLLRLVIPPLQEESVAGARPAFETRVAAAAAAAASDSGSGESRQRRQRRHPAAAAGKVVVGGSGTRHLGRRGLAGPLPRTASPRTARPFSAPLKKPIVPSHSITASAMMRRCGMGPTSCHWA